METFSGHKIKSQKWLVHMEHHVEHHLSFQARACKWEVTINFIAILTGFITFFDYCVITKLWKKRNALKSLEELDEQSKRAP